MEATKGLAPSVKRIKFEDSEFGNFMVRIRRAEIVWRVIGLLGFTLPFIILFENSFFFFLLEYMEHLIDIKRTFSNKN